MKYFAALIIVVLLVVLVWVVFYSGWLLHKKMNNPSAQSSTPAASSVVLETSMGTIKVALNYDAAPATSENFAKLVKQGFYNGLTFHRIIPGFVVQGGDPAGNGAGGPGYTVPAEIKLPHKRGVIAMARTGDQINPERASSGSQFYITLADLPSLDAGGYTVFGKVVFGMDVVDKIAAVKTDPSNDKPITPVIINKAYLESSK